MPPGLAKLLLPLRRYADFRGRSTRSEFVAFWLLTMLLGVLLFPLGYGVAREVADLTLATVTICPMAALGVRRLHDQGRSGWWLLPGLPAVLWSFWTAIHGVQDPYTLAPKGPAWFQIACLAGVLTVMILMALHPQSGPNRYGLDPREDPSLPY
ncbi:MAG TPA: DUF805 domain-containing protein [Allosphingosinicella sp.]